MKYREQDLVRIAKRENNTKRTYLVVDPLQGKHVPVSPTKALTVFATLAEEVQNQYPGEKLLVIGFAETATAIGAGVAIALKAMYMQTTREIIPNAEYLFFSEAHSHATEQKLVKNDIDQVITGIDRILFVEDEVTTGNTIMNIITLMKKEYGNHLKFSVASLLNGMTGEYLEAYRKQDIALHYLVKTDHSGYGEIAERFAGDGEYVDCTLEKNGEVQLDRVSTKTSNQQRASLSGVDVDFYQVNGYLNARRVVDPIEYERAIDNLAEKIKETCETAGRILVLGTEEFMYPALAVGRELERMGCEVRSHSTTRSPIAVSTEDTYPLHCRYALQSLYDEERKTFLYDIDEYDQVIIVTDAPVSTPESNVGLLTLCKALSNKNKKITVFRWCES